MVASSLILLVAAPLVAANAIRRQVSAEDTLGLDLATVASFTNLATNEVTDSIALPTGTDLGTAIDTEIPSSTVLGGGDIAKCVIPATITPPPGVPTIGSAAANFAATVTNECQLFGSDVPSAVAADVSSYTSALSVWASQNAAGISSYEQALNSFISSVKTDSVCASLYSTAASVATDAQAACSGLGPAKSAASKATSSAAGAGSAGITSAAGSGLRTTTGAAANSGAATGAAASTTRPAGTGAGSTIAPHNTVLMAGASIAFTSFIGMLFL